MEHNEVEELVVKMYYSDEENLRTIQKKLKEYYGITMTKEEIYNTYISGEKVKINRPTGRYRKVAAPTTILVWLKKGYSEEQIRTAAMEVGVEITEEIWRESIKLYEELNSKKEGEGR